METLKFRLTGFLQYGLSFLLYSCSHVMDTAKTIRTWPFEEGRMQFYPDSNVIIYRSSISFRADTEIWHSKPFQTQFPKGLMDYDYCDPEGVVFYYKDKEVIAIYINIQDPLQGQDSIYEPGRDELFRLIPSKFSCGRRPRLSEISYSIHRKNLIVQGKGYFILFYNIKPNNLDQYKMTFKGFHFL